VRYGRSGVPTGATGGGYILSRGTVSRATLVDVPGVAVSVNGDGAYDARTTRRAVSLLLSELGRQGAGVRIDQRVDTPIGSGFGASAAAATSAVYAVAAALGAARPKRELALSAYRAEIAEQTGLGTVSVIFDATGAGAITVPGEPGAAKFVAVRVPRGTRLVTAHFAPFDKREALAHPRVRARIDRLGREALRGFLADPTLDNLAAQGERFSAALGLESLEVKKAIARAKEAGASRASQNMIGHSVHCVVDPDREAKVRRAMKGLGSGVRVDGFEIGRARAGVLGATRRSPGPS
jgi:pantoate kinase